MGEGGSKFNFSFLEKLKKIKHIEIYVLIAFVAIIGLIFFSTKKQTTIEKQTTISSYVSNMENRLSKILSKIDGVSDVNVMIALSTDEIEVSGAEMKSDTFPSIQGIIITAKGVNDTNARMKVLHAVETVFDINSHNIQIFSSN